MTSIVAPGTERLRPLNVAILIKQVPVAETLELDEGRLKRSGVALEMSPYCRRAVTKGVELARESGGHSTVFTLGPPSAEDVLREALAWGADIGVHLCDPMFAGSDTLATSRALAAALSAAGPFDLVIAGRNTIDGETGQVGPQVAELLGLAFAAGVRTLEVTETSLSLLLEIEDGSQIVDVDLPAVISVAERLCEPCKVEPEGRVAVAAERIRQIGAAELGRGPWGAVGSPTVVGAVRAMSHQRARLLVEGSLEVQVDAAVHWLSARGALTKKDSPQRSSLHDPRRAGPRTSTNKISVGVVVERDRIQLAEELIGAAHEIADRLGGGVEVLCPEGFNRDVLSAAGAQSAVEIVGSQIAEDVAAVLTEWIAREHPSVILAPSTAFGREVAARAAAATNSGLIGDAIAIDVLNGRLVAAKPAFAGALVADITCQSDVQFVTVRPGVLPAVQGAPGPVSTVTHRVRPLGRIRLRSEDRTHSESLNKADVVVGIGAGVHPEDYADLEELTTLLGAEIAATRKVTDKGWIPHARQVGLTGLSLAPRLYVAIGLSGKFNHMVGVRAATTVLAINEDPNAQVFNSADFGIVGDWRHVVPLLVASMATILSSPVPD